MIADRFFLMISGRLDYVVENFSSRWLISVIDTYIDGHPDSAYQSAATIVSTALNWERFALTLVATSGDSVQRIPASQDMDILDLWNPGTDTHKNIIRRIRRQLSPCPEILKIFRELMLRNLRDSSGLISRLNLNHVRDLVRDVELIISVDPDYHYGLILASELPVETDQQFIQRSYEVVLQREPDEGGQNYYLGLLRDGTKREKIVEALVESDEFYEKQTMGNPN